METEVVFTTGQPGKAGAAQAQRFFLAIDDHT